MEFHISKSKKTIVVMPAYNASTTIERTYHEIPKECIDEIIVVDDSSSDDTVKIAENLDVTLIQHKVNRGYGANQKTCYNEALKKDPDIIVMLHPDYQYDPKLIPYFIGFVSSGICDIMLGNRIRTRKESLRSGMPLYKYIGNRVLTLIENICSGQNLGEFHSGFRVYKSKVLQAIDYSTFSDDFLFDTQFLFRAIACGFTIGDAPMPVHYFPEASSIDFHKSLRYGLGTLFVVFEYLIKHKKQGPQGRF